MTQTAGQWLLSLCAAAAGCAAALALCPEGRVRRVLRIVCGAVMAVALLSPVRAFDLDLYARAVAQYGEEARALGETAEAESDRLSRGIIEEECAAYIWDKADTLGLQVSSVQVGAHWSDDGCWYPWEAELAVTGDTAALEALSAAVESELGIPRARQQFTGEA